MLTLVYPADKKSRFYRPNVCLTIWPDRNWTLKNFNR